MGITKVVLLEIINKRLLFELGIIIILYLIFWRVSFMAGSLILGVKTRFNREILASLIMTLFSICVCLLIPDFLDIIRAFAMAVLVILLLRFTGKAILYKTYWASLIICCYGLVGDTVVSSWCYLGGKSATGFFLATIWGNIAVILIKIIFVTAALFIVPKLKISLIPPRRTKIIKIDKIALWCQGLIYIGFYASILAFYDYLHTDPHVGIRDMFVPWAVAYVAIIGQYIIAYDMIKSYAIDQRLLGLELCEILRMNPDLKWEDYFPALLKAYGVERKEAAAAIQSVIDKNNEEIKRLSS